MYLFYMCLAADCRVQQAISGPICMQIQKMSLLIYRSAEWTSLMRQSFNYYFGLNRWIQRSPVPFSISYISLIILNLLNQCHACFTYLIYCMNSQELACIICTLLPAQPVESDCCGRIFCQGCLSQVSKMKRPCPICRTEQLKYRRSKAIERLLAELQKECEQCGKKIKIKEYKSHSIFCALKFLKCKFCNQNISKDQFFNHLKLTHQQIFFQEYLGTLQQENIRNTTKCSKSHSMDIVLAGGSYGCQVCLQCYTGNRYKLLKCLICLQTRCLKCFSMKAKTCTKGHNLAWMRTKPKGYFGGARCDQCKTSIVAERGFMHCNECKYDLDRLCFQS